MAKREASEQKREGRRGFLKAAGLLTVGLAAGCKPRNQARLENHVGPEEGGVLPTAEQYEGVPYTPTSAPPEGSFKVFTPHEAHTVEALCARILPGTPDDPGAREAGVVYYIDGMLSYHQGFVEKTYREPPFAQTYTGNAPPSSKSGPSKVVWVPADQIYRYGYQSVLSPRDVYRLGVAGVDRYCQGKYGKEFVGLSEAQQDELIGLMAGGKIPAFDKNLTASSFFQNLRRHTAEGMFSDPVYGGNRNLVGWKLVGFPGAQRAYTPAEFQTEGTRRKPQGLTEMHAMNPGQPANDRVTLPSSGVDMQHQH